MKTFEKVVELIKKFIAKTKDSHDFIETLCNAALKNVIILLTLPQNENLLNDDDYIFIDDLFHCEKHSKQFLKYLSNILIMKMHHDNKIKQLFQNYCDLLDDGKRVDSNELCYNTNQMRQLIVKADHTDHIDHTDQFEPPIVENDKGTESVESVESVESEEKDISNFIGFLNDEYFDELFHKMQNAQQINIQMNSVVDEIDAKVVDMSPNVKKLIKELKNLILTQKEVFKDEWTKNESQ